MRTSLALAFLLAHGLPLAARGEDRIAVVSLTSEPRRPVQRQEHELVLAIKNPHASLAVQAHWEILLDGGNPVGSGSTGPIPPGRTITRRVRVSGNLVAGAGTRYFHLRVDPSNHLGETARERDNNLADLWVQVDPAPVLPRNFAPFEAGATGHSWVNAYLLALLSHSIYEQSLGASGFEQFQQRFHAKMRNEYGFASWLWTWSRGGWHTQAAVVNQAGLTIVFFRGTEGVAPTEASLRDWATNLRAQPHSVGGLRLVHRGFWDATDAAYGAVRDTLRAAPCAGTRVWVTGHSLGGAIALLTAYRLATDGVPVQGVATFGAPRVGNGPFRDHYRSLFSGRLPQQWVNDHDLVPTVPPPGPPAAFIHPGQVNHIRRVGNALEYDFDAREASGGLSVADHSIALYARRMWQRLDPQLRERVPERP